MKHETSARLDIEVVTAYTLADMDKAEWDSVCGRDYFLSYDYLLHVERSMRESYRYAYVLVRRHGESVLGAPLFYMDICADTLLDPGRMKTAAERIRRILPSAFRIRSLVVGSPPSIGNFGIAEKGGNCYPAEMAALARTLTELRDKGGAKLVLYKEMPEAFRTRYKEVWEEEGLIFGFDMPNNWFDVRWHTDEEYLAAMRGKSRQAIRKSAGKLSAKGVCVKRLTDTQKALGMREYEMYHTVLMKSDHIFEVLTKEYFSDICCLSRMDPCLVAIMKDDQIMGYFLVCDSAKDEIAAMFAGIDYRFNNDYDVYFNLFHEVIIYAMSTGKKRICFGQNTYEVKQRMGCRIEELYIGLTHRSRLLNRILARLSAALLPRIEISGRRVFKEDI